MTLLSLWRGPIETRRTMPDLCEEVAALYGVSVELIKSRNTKKAAYVPRQHFMWLAHQQEHLSMPMIGRFLGLDHSSVHHGIQRHIERSEAETQVAA
jgi:chromosomal replication initiation ATPase DnaA